MFSSTRAREAGRIVLNFHILTYAWSDFAPARRKWIWPLFLFWAQLALWREAQAKRVHATHATWRAPLGFVSNSSMARTNLRTLACFPKPPQEFLVNRR